MIIKTQLKAEDHVYFANRPGSKSSTFEELGIMPFANAPEPFLPDISKLCANGSMLDIAKMVSRFDQSQIRILQYLLTQAHDLSDENLVFGQTLYYRIALTPEVYLSDFVTVRPIGVQRRSQTTFIVCCAKLEENNGTCLLIERSSLLTRSEFKEVYRDLLATDRVTSPTPLWTKEVKTIKDVPSADIIKTVQMTPALKQELRKPRRKGNFTIKLKDVN